MSALVSIVIPIYNVEKYIHKCIESVLGQTYKNLEIILVEDGSPDRCPSICDKYAQEDKRIKVVHKENGGLSDARNAGIEIAKGDFIAFIDGDDYIAPNMIEVLLKLSIAEQACITVCNYCRVFSNGKEIPRKTKFSTKVMNNIEALEDLFMSPSCCEVMTWNKLYDLSLFKQNAICFPKGKIHEDNFTTYKLFYAAKKIVYTDTILYYYVQRADSIMSKKFNLRRLDLLEAVKQTKDFVKLYRLPLDQQVTNYEMMMHFNILNSMVYSVDENRAVWKKIRSDLLTMMKPLLRNPYVSVKHKIGLLLLKFGVYSSAIKLYNSILSS